MAQQPSAKAKGKPARTQSVGLAIGVNVATPVSNIRTMNDFQVELLYSVPGAEQR